jgi:hypothetical protein
VGAASPAPDTSAEQVAALVDNVARVVHAPRETLRLVALARGT